VAGDQPQGPPAPDPGRSRAGHRDRLVGLHELAPGLAARPAVPMAVAFLLASSTPAERDAAAQAHEAQAAQLRGPVVAAYARAFELLAPAWHAFGFRKLGPRATVAELLAHVSPELAGQVRGELLAAGVDPDALRWPPVVSPPGWPGA
jgi:hypothetical protein